MNGIELYRGPSALNDEDIVVILTGLTNGSANRKTGDMLQTWILRRDRAPTDAVRDGSDDAICGDCFHRGDAKTGRKRSCYVNVGQAPNAVWRAWRKGRYAVTTASVESAVAAYHRRAVRGGRERALVRLGAYGDPAAVPLETWRGLHALLERHFACAPRWTGYTHQWRRCSPAYRHFLMASVDSLSEQREAELLGWRTFRVVASAANDGELLALPRSNLLARVMARGEISCPASAEAGVRSSCERCVLCSGARMDDRRANIVILEH